MYIFYSLLGFSPQMILMLSQTIFIISINILFRNVAITIISLNDIYQKQFLILLQHLQKRCLRKVFRQIYFFDLFCQIFFQNFIFTAISKSCLSTYFVRQPAFLQINLSKYIDICIASFFWLQNHDLYRIFEHLTHKIMICPLITVVLAISHPHEQVLTLSSDIRIKR